MPYIGVQRFTIWVDFINLKQPDKSIDSNTKIERDFYTVDGYTLLELDYYPQKATTIDISSGASESSFKPPLFKDDTDLGFNLLDPIKP